MYAAAEKKRVKNGCCGAAYSVAQSKPRGSTAKGFVDNRPDTKRLRRLKATIQNKRRSPFHLSDQHHESILDVNEASKNASNQKIKINVKRSKHKHTAQHRSDQNETTGNNNKKVEASHHNQTTYHKPHLPPNPKKCQINGFTEPAHFSLKSNINPNTNRLNSTKIHTKNTGAQSPNTGADGVPFSCLFPLSPSLEKPTKFKPIQKNVNSFSYLAPVHFSYPIAQYKLEKNKFHMAGEIHSQYQGDEGEEMRWLEERTSNKITGGSYWLEETFQTNKQIGDTTTKIYGDDPLYRGLYGIAALERLLLDLNRVWRTFKKPNWDKMMFDKIHKRMITTLTTIKNDMSRWEEANKTNQKSRTTRKIHTVIRRYTKKLNDKVEWNKRKTTIKTWKKYNEELKLITRRYRKKGLGTEDEISKARSMKMDETATGTDRIGVWKVGDIHITEILKHRKKYGIENKKYNLLTRDDYGDELIRYHIKWNNEKRTKKRKRKRTYKRKILHDEPPTKRIKEKESLKKAITQKKTLQRTGKMSQTPKQGGKRGRARDRCQRDGNMPDF